MRVTVITEGGFTGRGIGTRSADVDVEDVHPESWRDEYRAHGYDLVLYTLTVGERSVSFNETAEIPKDLRRLFERVWK